jgi:hypothetical protein
MSKVFVHVGLSLDGYMPLREPGPQFRIDRVLDGPDATHVRYVRR